MTGPMVAAGLSTNSIDARGATLPKSDGIAKGADRPIIIIASQAKRLGNAIARAPRSRASPAPAAKVANRMAYSIQSVIGRLLFSGSPRVARASASPAPARDRDRRRG